MRPHQYKVSEVLILISPHIAGRYRFQVLQTDVLRFHISTIPSISINMKSFPSIWGFDTDVCIHLVLSTHKYCSYVAILCQPPHSEKCFISDNICSQISPKRSLTRFPCTSSTCVYLRSHLLLTSCSTNLGIYTHLNLRQDFKIPISTLFCYKWTVTELYEDKEIERDQFKMVIVRVTTLIRIIRTGQQWIQIFVQIWLTSILNIQTYVFIHTEQQCN